MESSDEFIRRIVNEYPELTRTKQAIHAVLSESTRHWPCSHRLESAFNGTEPWDDNREEEFKCDDPFITQLISTDEEFFRRTRSSLFYWNKNEVHLGWVASIAGLIEASVDSLSTPFEFRVLSEILHCISIEPRFPFLEEIWVDEHGSGGCASDGYTRYGVELVTASEALFRKLCDALNQRVDDASTNGLDSLKVQAECDAFLDSYASYQSPVLRESEEMIGLEMAHESLDTNWDTYRLFCEFADAAICAKSMAITYGEAAGVRLDLRGWCVLLRPSVSNQLSEN